MTPAQAVRSQKRFKKAGLILKLYIGSTRMQYPLEDVQEWNDRTFRTVHESRHDEIEPDTGVIFHSPKKN